MAPKSHQPPLCDVRADTSLKWSVGAESSRTPENVTVIHFIFTVPPASERTNKRQTSVTMTNHRGLCLNLLCSSLTWGGLVTVGTRTHRHTAVIIKFPFRLTTHEQNNVGTSRIWHVTPSARSSTLHLIDYRIICAHVYRACHGRRHSCKATRNRRVTQPWFHF